MGSAFDSHPEMDCRMSYREKALEALVASKALYSLADSEGRTLTTSEAKAIERHLADAQRYQATHKVEDLLGGPTPVGSYNAGGKSIGDIFVQSPEFKKIQHSRPQTWSTGPIEAPAMYKGTLLEGSGAPGSGTGGGLVPVPQFVPGVVNKLTQPLYLESLLSSGQATTSTVRR